MRSIIRNILSGVLVLASVQFVSAQDTLKTNKTEKAVDKYLTYFSGENPGAVVAVIKKGNVIFKKAYGLNNISTSEELEGNELFNLGELSKSITALAVLKLVEKGKLDLGSSIKEVLLDFPEYGNKISIKHLMDHKSGLVNYNQEEIKSNEEVYNFLLLQDKGVFESGTKFSYSNSDYPLLVKIIEKSSEMTYQEFIRKYIFKKLKLDNTFFIEEIEDKNVARSHFKENDSYVMRTEKSQIYGDRGIYMSVEDYVKYDAALYTDKLLKCENLNTIFRVGKLENRENISDYSCGWALMAKLGIRYFWQGGSQNGYSNIVLHLPDTQTTVLIFTNRNDGYDFLKMSIYIAKLFDTQLML